MRVVFFLCLLQAASGEEKLTSVWSVLTYVNGGEPSPLEVCTTSEQSASCCLMQNQMARMEVVYNHSISELDVILQSAKTRINQMINSRSAFSVSLNNDDVQSCVGPFERDETVVYKHIFINQDVYNVGNGQFRAARAGVYNFAITINKLSSGHNTACVSVQVNGVDVATLTEITENDASDTAMTSLVVQLHVGDLVEVKLKTGCAICDDKTHLNTFTGFLLYLSM